MDTVIRMDRVSMHYNLMAEGTNSLKEFVIRLLKGRLLYDDFVALDDVSFEIGRGELVGIIGYNGSGKSTTLKLLAGVLSPTSGTVEVEGEVAPLIELGAGFDPELTAEENIYLNGAIQGHPHSYMKSHFDEILDFSELHEFVHVPLKNFSSGMKSRLGFAVATAVEPDILLVDEVLSVGDHRFRRKCEERIQGLISRGVTVVLVSHNTDLVSRMCPRVIWLEKGRVRAAGNAAELCAAYRGQK